MSDADEHVLKKDLFGQVSRVRAGDTWRVVRDVRSAPLATRWIARRLLAREARALAAADGLDGVPALLDASRDTAVRSYLEGQPMQLARPTDPAYFRAAKRLLRQLHRAGIVHNDLAKEPNWIVDAAGRPGIVDFQLAWFSPRPGRTFRLLAREDLRHLLKHKRTYCAASLTRRESALLATPAWPTRVWRATGKRVYLFVTRRLLGWADREGAGDRQHGTRT